jgi:hypothetical protein
MQTWFAKKQSEQMEENTAQDRTLLRFDSPQILELIEQLKKHLTYIFSLHTVVTWCFIFTIICHYIFLVIFCQFFLLFHYIINK